MSENKLILASKSPRRRAILNQLGVSFVARESDFTETKIVKGHPTREKVKKLVLKNARGKALDMAGKENSSLIVGIDTMVVCRRKLLGKPKDEKDAFDMLSFMNGRMHEVFSGICVVKKTLGSRRILTEFECSKVYFRKASKKEIMYYVKTKEPLDKAGSYGIQERGAMFVDRITGDYFNVVGFPLAKFIKILRKLDIKIIDL